MMIWLLLLQSACGGVVGGPSTSRQHDDKEGSHFKLVYVLQKEVLNRGALFILGAH
jgi:hypothetical protein